MDDETLTLERDQTIALVDKTLHKGKPSSSATVVAPATRNHAAEIFSMTDKAIHAGSSRNLHFTVILNRYRVARPVSVNDSTLQCRYP
jgi:hypothetical protein